MGYEHLGMHVCMHPGKYMCVCMYVCRSVGLSVCVHACMYVRTNAGMYVCGYACVNACMLVKIYKIYTPAYIYIDIYVYTLQIACTYVCVKECVCMPTYACM